MHHEWFHPPPKKKDILFFLLWFAHLKDIKKYVYSLQ